MCITGIIGAQGAFGLDLTRFLAGTRVPVSPLGRGPPRPCPLWLHLVRTVTMPAMWLSNLHPDLKLGLLLVVAAVCLEGGFSGTFWAANASGQLDRGPSHYGWLSAAGSLGSLSVVAASIWVDSRPPHGMMAAGTLVLAIGLPLLTLSDSFGLAVVATFIAGTGGLPSAPSSFTRLS